MTPEERAANVEIDTLHAALVECLRFLIVEEQWHCFRAEFLSGGDQEKENVSERNAEKLRRFLRDLAAKDAAIAACLKECGDRPDLLEIAS